MATRRKQTSEVAVREIRRKTRRRFAPEEKIRIVLDGLRGTTATRLPLRASGSRWAREQSSHPTRQVRHHTPTP